MIINDVQFNCELIDVLTELQSQLAVNGIPYLQKLKDSGDDIMVTCPYHSGGQERRPSAGIRKSDGLFHCFACGEVHQLHEVISYCLGHAEDIIGSYGWNWLLKNFAVVEKEERKSVEVDFSRDHHSINNITPVRSYVREEELERYRFYHPYMYERGITDEIIDLFDIGYDVDSDCITFPIRDVHGNCLFVAKRSVRGKFYNYPKGVEKPLYGLYELTLKQVHQPYAKFDEIIVCEGMFDALTCWVYGKPAVALNGLGNELQFDQLRKLPCRKLILATDNDEAGMSARNRIRKNVPNKLITEYLLPKGKKDINELNGIEFNNLKEVF